MKIQEYRKALVSSGNHSLLKEYLEAEERFSVLFSDIQNIIIKGVDLDIDLEEK